MADDERFSEDDSINDSEDEEYCPNDKELKEFEEEKISLRKRKINEEEEEEEIEEEEKEDEQSKKTRMDDLWASFKKDTKSTISSRSISSRTNNDKSSTNEEVSREGTDTIKIKKCYDYAGEEVIVEKEVSLKSKEAKNYLQAATTSSTPTTGATPTTSTTPTTGATPNTGATVKPRRVGGAQALLASLNKKPKLSTLEKSRIDWNDYKKEEGLEEELTFQAKDGFLERQAFLNRSDVRQFELERDERLKRFKRLH